MARKKRARVSAREKARRAKIRKGLRRYHNDVRAVKKATGLGWRDSQKLIPRSVRRPGGKLVRRGDLLDLAKERHAVERETEYIPPPETAGEVQESIEGKSVEITYVDLIEFLIQGARAGHTVEIATPFYQLDAEKLEPGPRPSEISRAFGAAGDQAHKDDKNRYWRIRETFKITFSKNGWVLL